MRPRDGKWAGLVALAVASAIAVVAAGASTAPPDAADEAAAPAAAAAATGAAIEVVGADGVAATREDPEGFASALSAYLRQGGSEARTAVLAADPDDPGGDAFYASAGGLWYRCERTGGASGWAFASLGANSPFPTARIADQAPRQQAGDGRASDPGPSSSPAPAPADAEPPGGWIPLSDAGGLEAALGQEAAGQLAEALAGYARSKGVGFDPGAARVDASSVREEPGGVGFEADTGAVAVDAIYADGAFGFKVVG